MLSEAENTNRRINLVWVDWQALCLAEAHMVLMVVAVVVHLAEGLEAWQDSSSAAFWVAESRANHHSSIQVNSRLVVNRAASWVAS